MDTMRDSKPFQELMDQLCAALREGFKASDAMKDAYWTALKDVPFAEVKTNVQRLIATATKDTPFPRPASLRNKPPPVTPALPDPKHERAERASVARWRELRARDPVTFEVLFRSARAFTELARCDPEDPGYSEWLADFRRWDSLRYLPRNEQETRVRAYLGAS